MSVNGQSVKVKTTAVEPVKPKAAEERKERVQPTTAMMPNKAKEEDLNMEPMVSHENQPPKKDRISRASLKFDDAEDDFDPRFLNTLASAEGADLKRKFFKNTTPDYLM